MICSLILEIILPKMTLSLLKIVQEEIIYYLGYLWNNCMLIS